MTESKQEARLPERIEKAIIAYSDAHGTNCSLDCDDLRTLRSAILAALDEARDEALDAGLYSLQRLDFAIGNVAIEWSDEKRSAANAFLSVLQDVAKDLRALKSKRGA